MSTEIDEIKEKIAFELPRLQCFECPYSKDMHKCKEGKACRWQLDYAEKIIELETPTLRLAIVKKKAELPILDHNWIPIGWEGTIDEAFNLGQTKAQETMLDAGFVQEERE